MLTFVVRCSFFWHLFRNSLMVQRSNCRFRELSPKCFANLPPVVISWKQEKWRKDVSNFDKAKIVMAKLLGQRTASLVGCFKHVVGNTYQKDPDWPVCRLFISSVYIIGMYLSYILWVRISRVANNCDMV